MNHGIRRFITAALAVSAGLALTGCETRSAEEVEALRAELKQALDSAPLPADAQLLHADAEFDEGCLNLAECPSGGHGYASYSVPLRLPGNAPQDNAARCRYLVEDLTRQGLALVTEWEGISASYDERKRGSGLGRFGDQLVTGWMTVDNQACDTGNVVSAAIVRRDGTDPLGRERLFVSSQNAEGEPEVRYSVGVDIDDDGPNPRLPADNPPLTDSQLAYLHAELDQEFVLLANPMKDGIQSQLVTVSGNGSESRSSRVEGTWSVPAGVKALRFRVLCAPGDGISISAEDATKGSDSTGRTEKAGCTGRPGEVELPAFRSTKLEMWHDGKGEGPMVVEFVPARRS